MRPRNKTDEPMSAGRHHRAMHPWHPKTAVVLVSHLRTDRSTLPMVLLGGMLIFTLQQGCTLEFPPAAQCGDGVLVAGEECDGPSMTTTLCADLGLGAGQLSCNADCTFDISQCALKPEGGNGIKEYGESCDGTDLGGARCEDLGLDVGILSCGEDCHYDTTLCTGIRCGNGLMEEREDCDDGNNLDNDGCSSICGIETGWKCEGEPSSCSPECGDGLVVGDEDCDVDSDEGKCEDIDAGYGEVTCSPGCQWDTSKCVTVTDISGGSTHTCAVTSNGSASCWGTTTPANSGTAPPLPVPGQSKCRDCLAASSRSQPAPRMAAPSSKTEQPGAGEETSMARSETERRMM